MLESEYARDVKTRSDLVKELSDNRSLPTSHPSSSADPSSHLRLNANEVFEITKRKLNVIINGLPEAGNDIEHFWILPTLTITCRRLLLQTILTMLNDWVGLATCTVHGFSVYESTHSTPADSCWKCGRILSTAVVPVLISTLDRILPRHNCKLINYCASSYW